MPRTMLVTGNTAGSKTPGDLLGGDCKQEDKPESRIISGRVNESAGMKEAELGRGHVLPQQRGQEGLSEQRSDGDRSQVGPEHSKQRRSQCKGPEVEMSFCLRTERMAEWLGQREQGR